MTWPAQGTGHAAGPAVDAGVARLRRLGVPAMQPDGGYFQCELSVRPLGGGWALMGEGFANQLFHQAADAEQAGRRLACALAFTGRDVLLDIHTPGDAACRTVRVYALDQPDAADRAGALRLEDAAISLRSDGVSH